MFSCVISGKDPLYNRQVLCWLNADLKVDMFDLVYIRYSHAPSQVFPVLVD